VYEFTAKVHAARTLASRLVELLPFLYRVGNKEYLQSTTESDCESPPAESTRANNEPKILLGERRAVGK
jgi:hypothetical protein